MKRTKRYQAWFDEVTKEFKQDGSAISLTEKEYYEISLLLIAESKDAEVRCLLKILDKCYRYHGLKSKKAQQALLAIEEFVAKVLANYLATITRGF